MRLDEFKELCKVFFKRQSYGHKGNRWHAKQLVYCRHRVLNEKYDDIAGKEAVIVGQMVHFAIGRIMGYSERAYVKSAGDYEVAGTPDLIFAGVPVEVKFTSYAPKKARSHDVRQLRIYMWLVNSDTGYLWYISPNRFTEFKIGTAFNDDNIISLIESPKYPAYTWECKYCSLYPCEHVR